MDKLKCTTPIDIWKPVFPHSHCSRCGVEFNVYNYKKRYGICTDCIRETVKQALRNKRDRCNPNRVQRTTKLDDEHKVSKMSYTFFTRTGKEVSGEIDMIKHGRKSTFDILLKEMLMLRQQSERGE